MRFGNDNIEQLMFNIDLNNTLHGGSVETKCKIEEYGDEYIAEVKIPGINSSKLRLRVFKRQILLMHVMDYEVALNGQTLSLTRMLRKIPLPINAGINGIDAVHNGNKLFVFIPRKDDGILEDVNIDIEIK